MRKFAACLMILALTAGLAGCGERPRQTVPDPLPSQTVTATPTSTPPTVDVALTYDPEELKPWQTAYIQLLEDELIRSEASGCAEGPDVRTARYYLYDIDKDGTPELFLIDGEYWGDGIVYTFRQGGIKGLNDWTEVGAFHMDRSELYSWPDGNGVLKYRTTAYIDTMALYSIDGDYLGIEFLKMEEDHPTVRDHYPDSYYLSSYPTLTETPEREVNALPIVNYVPPQEPIKQENIFPRDFWHMTGVGGWSTEMHVEKDGTFEGNDNWHRIVEGGEDWEVYSCDFSGKFSEPEQVNNYTYSIQLEKLNIEPGWQGMESDTNLSKVEGTVPAGLEGGEEFLIYLPGASVAELPEEFLLWGMLIVGEDDTVLPSYGLYNVNAQIGWFEW